MAALLEVRDLVRTFESADGRVGAVRGVSFSIEAGEFFTLLGPSGCGKTTTLRCVAGLEGIDGGAITLAGRTVDDRAAGVHVPPHRRPLGMVFQSYAIWPHMTVFENVAYPLRVTGRCATAGELESRVMDALRLVKMDGLARRGAPLLSGGQQQRVALARALVARPALLLLDEPLSNLDAKLREEMRAELRQLVAATGVTTLFVTHDQDEALALSDRVAVMDHGTIVQCDTPQTIYQRPAARFVAQFIGTANAIDGRVDDRTDDTVRLSTAAGPILGRADDGTWQPGDAATAMVRPEDVIVLDTGDDDCDNRLSGTVTRVAFLGNAIECRVRTACGDIALRSHPTAVHRIGDTVRIGFRAADCRLFPGEHTSA
ncbi:MAG: ABC transporter ATP-binding protein [Vicinamibacterales bacterium]